MAEKLLEVKNLRTEFKRDKTWVTAVNNVSFSIQPGEILGRVGESGRRVRGICKDRGSSGRERRRRTV